MEGIFSSFSLVIGLLIFTFLVVNLWLSNKLWKPFFKTLSILRNYEIKKHENLEFDRINTTEFNKLNHVLSEMTSKIRSDFLQQKEFSENASHEMQTPLAIIKANLSLLMQSANLQEEEMSYLQAIEGTLKRLSALNKSLLLLTKIENNQFQNNQIIDLNEAISQVLDFYHDGIQNKNIQLNTTLESNQKLEINPILIQVLLSNLIQNAIRHNQKGGKIIVTSKGNRLTVANSGEPLSILKEDLFIRFKKNNNSNDSLGLGLSIVKSIVTFYNYSIDYRYVDHLHTFTVHF